MPSCKAPAPGPLRRFVIKLRTAAAVPPKSRPKPAKAPGPEASAHPVPSPNVECQAALVTSNASKAAEKTPAADPELAKAARKSESSGSGSASEMNTSEGEDSDASWRAREYETPRARPLQRNATLVAMVQHSGAKRPATWMPGPARPPVKVPRMQHPAGSLSGALGYIHSNIASLHRTQ